MKRQAAWIALGTGVLMMGTAGASAANCTIAYDGTNPNYAPDDSSFALLIDGFEALLGSRANCAPVVPAHSNTANDPDVFEVYRADVRGFVGPEDADRAKVTVKANNRTYTETFDINDDPVIDHYIGKESDGTLKSEIELEVTKANDPGTVAQIDTIDYALVGTMTRAQAEASLDDLGNAQTAMVTHLDATSGLLTGGNLSLEGDNEVRVLGGLGSYMIGGNVRYNISEGFSLLAGVSIIDQSAGGAQYTAGLGAAALRFVQPDNGGMRFFGEAGATGGLVAMQFSRTYTDDNSTQTVTGNGTGALGAGYLRGGLVVDIDDRNELVLSGSVKQTFVGFGDYAETVRSGNLFAADLINQSAGFTTAKITADWTSSLSQELDLTLHGGVGTTMANQATSAYIVGGGTTTGAVASTLFAEYGLGLGWHPSPDTTIEGFVQGSTGTDIGTHLQAGAGYRLKF